MEHNHRSQEATRITVIGFVVNAFLTVFKLFAGVAGRSGALLADGIHSLSDLGTDIIVLVGCKLTDKPEDDCHNYGHGKYETLATVIISIFLAIAGFELLRSGAANIVAVIQGEVLPRPGTIALAAAATSIVSKELLFHYTIRVGEKTNSSVIKANAWHHRSDTFSSVATLLGVGGAIFLGEQWTVLDPIAAVIVSILIFKVAIEILLPAVNELMETSLDDSEVAQITEIIAANEHASTFHKLRTRRIGTIAAIEFHLLLDGKMNLQSAHHIATAIEHELKACFNEECIITIHIEPHDSH